MASRPPADPHAPDPGPRSSGVSFGRAVSLMLMTLVLPGSAQLAAGNGRIALRTFLGLVAAVVLVVVIGLLDGSFVFWLLSNTFFLGLVRFLLMVLAVGWAYLFVDAWRLGDPLRNVHDPPAMIGAAIIDAHDD